MKRLKDNRISNHHKTGQANDHNPTARLPLYPLIPPLFLGQ